MARWWELRLEVPREVADDLVRSLRGVASGLYVEEPLRFPDPRNPARAEPDPERPLQVRAYFPPGPEGDLARARAQVALELLAQVASLGVPEWRLREDEEWLEAWKAHFQPTPVGRRWLLVPAWWTEPVDDGGRRILRIDPGGAFGSGLHPTTQLCLEALEEGVGPGERWLDLGTGSGILAVAAALLGAREVVALDVDPGAVAAARENARRNGVADRVVVLEGSLGPEGAGTTRRTFDGIVANIVLPVLEELAPWMARALRPGGICLASGLLEAQGEVLQAVWREVGLEPLGTRRRGEWVLVWGRRSVDTSSPED